MDSKPQDESDVGVAPTPVEVVSQNAGERQWQPLFPDFGADSPLLAILRADPGTGAITIMLKFPAPFHFPKHTHPKSETTVVLAGTHYFEDSENGILYKLEGEGYFYLPAHRVHQAWVAAGTLVTAILDGGPQIDWIDGPPQPGAPVIFPE